MDWLRCRNGFAGIPKLWRSRLSGFWAVFEALSPVGKIDSWGQYLF
jgi:hypothetical protein